VVTALAMTGGLMWQSPVRSLIGLAMLLSAVPLYFIWQRFVPRRAGTT